MLQLQVVWCRNLEGRVFDTITCMSVAKWVHIAGGDNELRAFFRKIHTLLRPGGFFVLEPQPWRSYKQASAKLVRLLSLLSCCLVFLLATQSFARSIQTQTLAALHGDNDASKLLHNKTRRLIIRPLPVTFPRIKCRRFMNRKTGQSLRLCHR